MAPPARYAWKRSAAEGVLGNFGLTCACHTAYHARCHAEMRSRYRLECAICSHRSTADGFDGTARMSLALLVAFVVFVAFVLSPPRLLARMRLLARGGPSPHVAEGVDVKSDVVRREPNPERAQ